MTDLWYYAEGEESRGPLSLTELVPLLARISDPRRVLIWRHGFTEWKPLEEVREVAQEVFRPPPLTKSPTPSPAPQPEPVEEAPSTPIREPAVAVEDAAAFSTLRPKPFGLGGWLALVAFGQIMGILRFVVDMGKYYREIDPKLWAQFPTTMWGEAAMNAAMGGLFVYTTVLMFRHSHRFPSFFIAQFVAVICSPFVAILWVGLTLSIATGRPFSEFMKMDEKEGIALLTAIMGAAIWIPYVRLSKRVKNTFVK